MAVMAIVNIPGATREQYDGLRPLVNWEGNPPAGLHFHAAGFGEDGALHVVDIWESPEHMQEFFQNRLGEHLAAIGMPEPQISIYPAHNINAFAPLQQTA